MNKPSHAHDCKQGQCEEGHAHDRKQCKCVHRGGQLHHQHSNSRAEGACMVELCHDFVLTGNVELGTPLIATSSIES